VRFRPNVLLRFGVLLPAALLCVPAATVWEPGLPLDEQLVFIVIFAVVVPLVTRWVVLSGVSLRENHLTVHGVWWSRRAPRDQAIRVRQKAGLMVLHWRDRQGRIRYTPIIAFTSASNDPSWGFGGDALWCLGATIGKGQAVFEAVQTDADTFDPRWWNDSSLSVLFIGSGALERRHGPLISPPSRPSASRS
jgi:hypothetical protein